MIDRGRLLTEQPNPRARELDTLNIADAFDVMNAEDAQIAAAVAAAKPAIVEAVERVSSALRAGGRLFYVGAGTSGRLGALDAAECPPTFLSDPEMVQSVIAGGPVALQQAVEHAEDDVSGAVAELERRGLSKRDVVFGIATSGTTPFVHGAIDFARSKCAATVFLACVPREAAPDVADISIRILTGPEVLAGSTRLKAGLATKMTLNMISTLSMARLGKIYGNRMVDVNARGCAKLTDRAIRTTMSVTGLPREAAEKLLVDADWHVKTALLMHAGNLDAAEARRRLDAVGGMLRQALAQLAG